MKRMKKLGFVMLAICLLAALLPAAAMAATANEVWVGGVKLTSGQYLASGASAPTSSKPAGGYAYFQNGKLTLNGYDNNGKYRSYMYFEDPDDEYYAALYAEGDLEVVLENKNHLRNSKHNSGGIVLNADQSQSASLEIRGKGSLDIEAGECILNWNGDIRIANGTLTLEDAAKGICALEGDVTISGGNVMIDVTDYGIYTSVVFNRLIDGDVDIYGGDVTIYTDFAGILSEEGDVDIFGGDVTIKGETLRRSRALMKSGETGIAALSGDAAISGGTLDIEVPGDDAIAAKNIIIGSGVKNLRLKAQDATGDGAICASENLSIDPALQIQSPAGGYAGNGSLLDANGRPAGEISIEAGVPQAELPKADLPKTGDASCMDLWLALCAVSCAGWLVCARRRSA